MVRRVRKLGHASDLLRIVQWHPLTVLAFAAGMLTALIGGGHLAAWLGGLMAQRDATAITIKTNAALALLFSGTALALLVYHSPWRTWTARACAAAALLIGTLTLFENITGHNLGIDQLLAHGSPGALDVRYPNRMGLPASLSFTLAGAALLLLSRRDRRWLQTAQTLALAVLVIALLPTIGYVYSVRGFYGVAGLTAIAWPMTLALLTLSLGILCARPRDGLMAQVLAHDAGGTIIRRLLIPALLLPVILGWLRLAGSHWGVFDAPMGAGLLTLSYIIIFTTLLYHTGRKLSQSAAAQRESEQRFSAFMHHLSGAVWMKDLQGRYVYINPEVERIFSMTHSQAQGKTDEEIFPPEIARQFRDNDRRALSEGGVVRTMEISRQPDGTEHLWLVNKFLMPGPDGQPAFIGGIAFDITERKQAEEALAESRQRLSGIVQSAMDAIITLDENQRIVLFNPAAEQMFRCPADQALGSPIDRFIPHRFREVHRHHIHEFARTGSTARAMGHLRPLSALRADGHEFPIEASISQVQVDNHKLFTVILRDITHRQQAETTLRQSEQRFRGTFENAAVGIAHVDAHGRLILVNQKLSEIFGLTPEELMGQRFVDLTHPEDREPDASQFAALMRGEMDSYAVEKRYLRKDGQWTWVLVTRGVQRDESGCPIYSISIVQDITWRKEAEQALQAARDSAERAKAAAEQANAAKDQFLAVLSHELRTPLTPVLMTAQMLETDPSLPEPAREQIEIIRRNVELEARLIDDLLDVTRIARGKIELDRKPVALCKVIHRAVEVVQADLEARGLHFGVDLGDAAPYLVHADPARLQQVFWNLLKNAIKFTPRGGCVGIRCRIQDHTVVAEVNDSGRGIDPAILPRIFKPFEQGGANITRHFGGLGLGLTITRGLVEMHGGSITALSDGMGKGATFRVKLPLHMPSQPHASGSKPTPGIAADQPQHPAPPEPRPLRILLVEDHGDTARIMRRLLMADGHDVATAGDVATALQLAASRPFDLLISDLGLPDGSGIDLIRELHARRQTLPAIALSGYGQEEDIRRSHDAGFITHLTKPTSPDRLAEAIAAITRPPPPHPPPNTPRPTDPCLAAARRAGLLLPQGRAPPARSPPTPASRRPAGPSPPTPNQPTHLANMPNKYLHILLDFPRPPWYAAYRVGP